MLGMKKVCRVRIVNDVLDKMTKEELHKSWLQQEQYLDFIEAKLKENANHSELVNLRESEEKLKQQQLEAIRKENILVMRLTTKEQEMQEYAGQIQELKQSQIPSISQLRSALLDPAVNLMFDRMRREIDSLKARLEETQNELNAWKFTPDSVTGKRLMAKCRLLYQENEELGKMISSGRIAKLEGDLALQKTFSEEMKKSQTELDDFLLELDEDLEGLQSTVCYLQQQLRESKEQIQKLQKENEELLGLSNTPVVNHRFIINDVEMNNKSREPSGNMLNNTSPPGVNSTPPTTPDRNRTDGILNSKPNRGTNANRTWSPPPSPTSNRKMDELMDIDEPSLLTDKVEAVQEQGHVEVTKLNIIEQTSLQPQTVKAEPVPVIENPPHVVPSHSFPITIPAVRGSLHVEEYDSEEEIEPSRTLEDSTTTLTNTHDGHIRATTSDSTKINVVVENPQRATNKRTSENYNSSGGRGRKRTRGSKVASGLEGGACEPVVTRLRRRVVVVDHEILEQPKSKRTPMELDNIDNTDTEVEVAQTLVNLAAAKKERKDLHIKPIKPQDLIIDNLGNGELLKRKSNVENA